MVSNKHKVKEFNTSRLALHEKLTLLNSSLCANLKWLINIIKIYEDRVKLHVHGEYIK